ncbi:MAG: PAS domain S-box protein [Labilithrix sp.]|nr:PAS domain S-box protein [Labilithrix sp.]MBX3220599.1 PAS domain S-box protein [Labilithrix sp.]
MLLDYARGMETRVEELKRYVRFTEDDARLLAAFAEHAAPHFRRIAQEFYERIREHEEAHAVFTGEEQIRRLQDSMVRWLERVFGGVYDEDYFRKTEQIGRVHVKVGLPQRYMLTAMAVIRSSLTTVIDEHAADAVPVGDALSRLLDIELAVMLESYRVDLMSRVERAARRETISLRRHDKTAEQYIQAVERAPLLVIGLDVSGGVVLFNREAERMTGYARDEVLGRSFVELLVPASVRGTDGAKLASATAEMTAELPLVTRAGKVRDVRWQVAPAAGREEGDVARFLIGGDVTEERIARERQQQVKRLAAVGTLAAGLAHEIRNPLNGARLHVSFLERALAREGGSTEALEAVHVVGDEIQRLARLVTEFLDFARPHRLIYGTVDARALSERAIQLVNAAARAGHVTLCTDFPARPLTFDGDAQRIEQVLLNVLQNAVEALVPKGGGTVTVRARREPRHVWIEIEDDGPGIPPGEPSIFDAFYSTKPTGTGLGLAIVHRIVTDHGGNIDVDSQPGRTRFRVTLPLERREAEE